MAKFQRTNIIFAAVYMFCSSRVYKFVIFENGKRKQIFEEKNYNSAKVSTMLTCMAFEIGLISKMNFARYH